MRKHLLLALFVIGSLFAVPQPVRAAAAGCCCCERPCCAVLVTAVHAIVHSCWRTSCHASPFFTVSSASASTLAASGSS